MTWKVCLIYAATNLAIGGFFAMLLLPLHAVPYGAFPNLLAGVGFLWAAGIKLANEDEASR